MIAENQALICRLDGVERILQSVSEHSTSNDMQRVACATLGVLGNHCMCVIVYHMC